MKLQTSKGAVEILSCLLYGLEAYEITDFQRISILNEFTKAGLEAYEITDFQSNK